MKIKNLILATVLCMFIVVMVSCSEKITTPATATAVTPQTEEAADLMVWNQTYFKPIGLKVLMDSVLFYNNAAIKLEKVINHSAISVENGIINFSDSTDNITKLIPRLTSGKLSEMKKGPRGENVMVVLFSRLDASYKLEFWMTAKGTYVLGGNAKLIFHGVEYPVKATITDSNDGYLMVYYRNHPGSNDVKGVAEGWGQH
jgi:hypothetical protein